MWSARAWVILASAIALGASAFYVLLPVMIRQLFRVMLALRYSFRVRGLENVPATGPALIAANHTSWLDGFVLAAISPREGKAMVNAGFLSNPVLHALAVRAGIIPTPFSGPRAIRGAIETCREALDRGLCVGLFPEGQISRNGLTGPFYRGIEVILKGRTDVPVIPVALDNIWGSVFSRSGGRYFWKWPEQRRRRTINIVFGPPVHPPLTAFAVRQAMLETMVHAYELRTGPGRPLETLDPSLPRWEHPVLGPLTGSAADIHYKDIHQIGHKEGSVGHPVPGVALRVVDDAGTVLPPKTEGRIEALVAGRGGWTDTGRRGSLDPDGFARLVGIENEG
jgi:1-acyl-sn-glycerol-3-phosphate acyltransferase